MSGQGNNSANLRVKSFIDRVLRLKEEQDALAADIREVYAEAKGEGYDKTALGHVVQLLRKKEKLGSDAFDERDALVQLYMRAYEGPAEVLVSASHTPAYARVEIIEEFPPSGASDANPDSHSRAPAVSASDEITAPHSRSTAGTSSQPAADQPETPTSSPEVSGSHFPRPALSAVSGDKPSIPSPAAGGVKTECRANGTPGRDDEKSCAVTAKAGQVATHSNLHQPDAASEAKGSASASQSSERFEPPAFLRKTAADYRPHCQHPEACAASGLKHCYACQKLADAAEVAA